MTSYDRRVQVLAGVLAALAGYVDASAFKATGAFFVSFMSGNSTRMGVGIVQGADQAAVAGGLIVCFVFGVTAGALISQTSNRRRPSLILGIVAALLATSAALHDGQMLLPAAGIMATAMGGMNNVFERKGQVSIPLTYMTGNLVKLGQLVASALLGTDKFGWLSHLCLWLGFIAGVLLGAAMYERVGLSDLWGAALAAAVLAGVASRINPDRFANRL